MSAPKDMSPPDSTNSLLPYTEGNRFFNAKPTLRFRLVFVSGPTDTYSPSGRSLFSSANTRSKPSASRISQDRRVNPLRAPRLGELLLARVHWLEWPDRREPRHGQLWERLL